MLNKSDWSTTTIGRITIEDSSILLCEPHMIELPDGSLITAFYAQPRSNKQCVIMQQKWKLS